MRDHKGVVSALESRARQKPLTACKGARAEYMKPLAALSNESVSGGLGLKKRRRLGQLESGPEKSERKRPQIRVQPIALVS